MADLARITLITAFSCALYSAFASVVGITIKQKLFLTSARNGLFAVLIFFTLSTEVMIYALVTDNFSIVLVAQNSSESLPIIYKLASLYSSKEGSLMFWGWLISVLAIIFIWSKRKDNREIIPYAVGIFAILQTFFLMMLVFVVNVFEEASPIPADGIGLNPLLQNIGMLIHPALLFIGFACFAIVFAYSVAALLSGNLDSKWANGVRRWVLIAWGALGLGNIVGAWWAYVELGWGGYWVWDPVENAGFMPWLLGTALLHSIALQRKRDYLKKWSLALVIFTFIFTLLSPFITHGGIESPLHGFDDSPFTPYLLGFMLITTIIALGILIARRSHLVDANKPESLLSREGLFLLSNIVIVSIVGFIFAGTIAPGISHNLSLERSFFDWTAGPVLLILVFIMGICPLVAWHKTSTAVFMRRMIEPLTISCIVSVIILITGIGNWYAIAALVCGFPLLVIIKEWFQDIRARHLSAKESYARAYLSLIGSNRSRYGGSIVHIGIILITIGVIGSSFYSVEHTTTLNREESTSIYGYDIGYEELIIRADTEKTATIATISITKGNRQVASMFPEQDFWFDYNSNYSESAIRSNFAEDIVISLIEYDVQDKSTTFRIVINPLIMWIWIGGGILLLGGLIAFWPSWRS
jgi:cytochrome c-type biogenesis protein CcmF